MGPCLWTQPAPPTGPPAERKQPPPAGLAAQESQTDPQAGAPLPHPPAWTAVWDRMQVLTSPTRPGKHSPTWRQCGLCLACHTSLPDFTMERGQVISSARGAARPWEPAPTAERLPSPVDGARLVLPWNAFPVTLSPMRAARGTEASGAHSNRNKATCPWQGAGRGGWGGGWEEDRSTPSRAVFPGPAPSPRPAQPGPRDQLSMRGYKERLHKKPPISGFFKQGALTVAGGHVRWCSVHGRQSGGSSLSEKQSPHTTQQCHAWV